MKSLVSLVELSLQADNWNAEILVLLVHVDLRFLLTCHGRRGIDYSRRDDIEHVAGIPLRRIASFIEDPANRS